MCLCMSGLARRLRAEHSLWHMHSASGQDKCITIGMAGLAPEEEKVIEGFERGCKAFGFTNDQVESAMELFLRHLPTS
ncbi:MAG: DUF2620 family protein [Collinsella sp.]